MTQSARGTAEAPGDPRDPRGVQSLMRVTAGAASGGPPIRLRVARGRVEEVLCEVDLDGVRYTLLRVRPQGSAIGLSRREREVASLVAAGLPTKAIARALSISAWTVCSHLRRVYARLGVGSRAAMVARLLEEGLL